MSPGVLPTLLRLAAASLAVPGAAALGAALGSARALAASDPGLRCIAPSANAGGGQGAANWKMRRQPRPRECQDWSRPLEDYTGRKALPLDDALWRGGYAKEFLPSQDDFARALRPAGYAGARLRLRRFLLQLVAGEPVEVSVLGGSMTVGRRGVPPWPTLLARHLNALGHNVTVHNLAVPSTGSEYAATHVVYDSTVLNRSGLIIIDTSINDWADWYRIGGGLGSSDSFDLLAQELLELPHRPAVVSLATIHMQGVNHTLQVRNTYCSNSLVDFPHARAELFQLPMFSFPDAMCRCCGPMGLWYGNLHPIAATHDAVARMLVADFALEADAACQADGLQVADHLPRTQDLQAAPFSECLRWYKKTNVDFTFYGSAAEGDQFVEGQHVGWSFAQDVPTKPFGWLLPSGSPPGKTISFKVNGTGGGWIRLDYLETYADIGSVTCWVDSVGPEGGCFINAKSDGSFSNVRSAYVGLSRTMGAELLHCRSNGGKFKVLGISSC